MAIHYFNNLRTQEINFKAFFSCPAAGGKKCYIFFRGTSIYDLQKANVIIYETNFTEFANRLTNCNEKII